MKFVAFGALAMIVAVAALLLMSRETSAAPKAGERIPGQYIVVFVDGVSPAATADEMAGEHGLRLLHVTPTPSAASRPRCRRVGCRPWKRIRE